MGLAGYDRHLHCWPTALRVIELMYAPRVSANPSRLRLQTARPGGARLLARRRHCAFAAGLRTQVLRTIWYNFATHA